MFLSHCCFQPLTQPYDPWLLLRTGRRTFFVLPHSVSSESWRSKRTASCSNKELRTVPVLSTHKTPRPTRHNRVGLGVALEEAPPKNICSALYKRKNVWKRRSASQKSSIISVKSVWKRCHMDLPGSKRKASRTSRLRPIIMWTRLFFKLPLQHVEI